MEPINTDNEHDTVIVIDPRGDLKLIAKGNIIFQVCSRTLARAAPFWDTLLYGPFCEGKEQQQDTD